MEGVGDRAFRRAMAAVGGFDQACTEFIRVPTNAHVVSLAKHYLATETTPIPQAAQIMGSDPLLMAEMVRELIRRGAPRIDLNCGCPSNTVTGRGAGSSLLKDPNQLYSVAKAMVDAAEGSSVGVTAKLRSGFEDTSLFRENLLAAQSSGIKFLTLHPRTKVDGYGPPARWDLIAEAKQLLTIPVIGNGDILNARDAALMLKETSCDGLMIGRAAVTNPFIFHEIKGSFLKTPFQQCWDQFLLFFNTFIANLPEEMTIKGKMNKIKQILGFLFKGNERLLRERQKILTSSFSNVEDYVAFAIPLYEEGWKLGISLPSLRTCSESF